MLTLNKWQRIVASLAAVVCFGRAAYLFGEDNPAGSAFIAGNVFAMLALSPSNQKDRTFPDPRPWLIKHWRKLGTMTLGIVVLGVGLTLGLGIVEARREAGKRAQAEKEHQAWEHDQASRLKRAEARYSSCIKRASARDGAFRILAEAECRDTFENKSEVDPFFRSIQRSKGQQP